MSGSNTQTQSQEPSQGTRRSSRKRTVRRLYSAQPSLPRTPQPPEASSEDESSDNNDDDFLPSPKATKRKKKPSPQRKAKRVKPSSRKKTPSSTSASVDDLHDALCDGGSAITPLSKAFLRALKKDEVKCVTALVNLVLKVSGCDQLLDADDVGGDSDPSDIVEKLVNECKVDESYPFSSRSKPMKRLQSRYREFFEKLVVNAKNHVLREGPDVMETVVEWITAISRSGLLALRHTASVAGYAVMDAFVTLAKDLQKQRAASDRQKQAETKKKKRVKARIRQLTEDIEELDSHLETVHGLLKLGFEGVFVHRYRDRSDVIRVMSLEALGRWIASYTKYFLTDNYLKYLGWCLSDKVVAVRKACVDAVQKIYKDEDNVDAMNTFVQRFLPRFLEMSVDTSPRVVGSTLDLLTTLLRLGLLTGDQGSELPSLIWDQDWYISRAAARFAFEDAIAVDDDAKESNGRELLFGDLEALLGLIESHCAVLQQTEDEEDVQGAYDVAVDSLWDLMPVLKVWDVMTELLAASVNSKKGKSSAGGVKLSENKLSMLAHLLLACAKKARGVLDRSKDKATGNAEDTIQEHSKTLSAHLFTELPVLLKTFSTDASVLTPLVRLCPLLDLDEFPATRFKKEFGALLQSLKDIYVKNSNRVLLTSTATAMCKLASDSPFERQAFSFLREMATQLVGQLGLLEEQGGMDDASSREALVTCLTRVLALCKQVNLTELQFNEELASLLATQLGSDGSEELVDLLLDLEWTTVLWSGTSITGPDARPTAENLGTVKDLRDDYVDNLLQLLETTSVKRAEKRKALGRLSDVFCTFPARLATTPARDLVLSLDQRACSVYVSSFERLLAADEKTDDNNALTRRLKLLVAAGGVVCHNFKSMPQLTASLLSTLLRFDTEEDMVVKHVCAEIRRMGGSEELLKAQLFALQKLYRDTDEDSVMSAAGRFVLMHPMKHQQRSFVAFLKRGVDFALQKAPSNLTFLLSALPVYVNRSAPNEVRDVLAYFVRCQEQLKRPSADDPDWEYLDEFEEVLEKRLNGNAGAASKRKKRPARASNTPVDEASPSEDFSIQNSDDDKKDKHPDAEVQMEEVEEDVDEESLAADASLFTHDLGFSKKASQVSSGARMSPADSTSQRAGWKRRMAGVTKTAAKKSASKRRKRAKRKRRFS